MNNAIKKEEMEIGTSGCIAADEREQIEQKMSFAKMMADVTEGSSKEEYFRVLNCLAGAIRYHTTIDPELDTFMTDLLRDVVKNIRGEGRAIIL